MICEKCGCDARVGSVSEQPDGAHVTYICANPQCSLCGQKIGEEILQPEKNDEGALTGALEQTR